MSKGRATELQAGVRAGIWFGTPESFIDLAQYLPPGYGNSLATCVEFHNGAYLVGGYANSISAGTTHAFVWIGVPAPSSAMALGAAGLIAARRRRRGRADAFAKADPGITE